MTLATLRIDYHSDTAELVRRCLVPAIGARGHLDIWVQLHWLYGPHVLVNVAGDSRDVEEATQELTAVIRSWLEANPSTETLDAPAYLTRSRELGRLELVPEPYEPIREDNVVSVADLRLDTFIRDEPTLLAKGRILARALRDPRFATLMGRPPGRNADTVYVAMGIIATAYPEWGLISGYQAFLSHWKEQFHWSDPTGRAEEALRLSFASQEERLVATLQSLASGGNPALHDHGEFWAQWRSAAWTDAVELAMEERVLPYPRPERQQRAATIDEETGLRWSGSDERAYSDFHQEFRRLDFTRLGNGTDFAAYRFLINCFFDLLPLLGVTAAQRYSLAYFLTSAAQIVVGEPWQTTLQRSIDRQANAGDVVPTLPWRGDSR